MKLDDQELLNDLSQTLTPLQRKLDLKPLVEQLGKARIVMLGESTHGTQEFYEWRRLISEWLIVKHGFQLIAVGGDWPPCWEVNQYIHSETLGNAREVLGCFNRWPTWMWANTETVRLVEWLKTHNLTVPQTQQIGFYGLDVYSLFESIDVVLKQLQKINPFLARRARNQFECFARFQRDEKAYVKFMGSTSESCEEEAQKVLRDVLQLRIDGLVDREQILFDAQNNARIVANAENYYRTMIHGNEDSWNVRDRHMLETLELLLSHHGADSKAIVWAHNTHIGDYRATDMKRQGLVNLGGLARERFGHNQVALLGFGTYEGEVIASRAWDGPIEAMKIKPGKEDSYEWLFHEASARTGHACFSVSFSNNELLKNRLSEVRGHRAIGVVYYPTYEHFGNYVPTSLSKRYDAFLYVDRTTSLKPLIQDFSRDEIPETWPMGQ